MRVVAAAEKLTCDPRGDKWTTDKAVDESIFIFYLRLFFEPEKKICVKQQLEFVRIVLKR